MAVTFTEVGIAIAILAHIGVFGFLQFVVKRFIKELDSKASQADLDKLDKKIQNNFEKDEDRDSKMADMLALVNSLTTDLKSFITAFESSGLRQLVQELRIIRTEVSVLDVKVKVLENRNENMELKVNNHEQRINLLEKSIK